MVTADDYYEGLEFDLFEEMLDEISQGTMTVDDCFHVLSEIKFREWQEQEEAAIEQAMEDEGITREYAEWQRADIWLGVALKDYRQEYMDFESVSGSVKGIVKEFDEKWGEGRFLHFRNASEYNLSDLSEFLK